MLRIKVDSLPKRCSQLNSENEKGEKKIASQTILCCEFSDNFEKDTGESDNISCQ